MVVSKEDYFDLDSYQMFVQEIKKQPVLTKEENEKLFRKYQETTDNSIKQKIINGNLRLILPLAQKYKQRYPNLDFMDLFQEGTLGLMKAFDNFNPNKASFSTYAFSWINQCISRYIGDKAENIRIPIHLQEKYNKYKSICNNYFQENKPLPTDEVFLELLDITPKMLYEIKQLSFYKTDSINRQITDDSESELGDFVINDDDESAKVLDEIDNKILFVVLKNVLTPVQYFIIYNRILSSERLTLEDIADYFNLTRERVRQLEGKCLKKLKVYMENNKKLLYFTYNKISSNIKNLDAYNIKPLNPDNIIDFFLLKDILTDEEKEILYFNWFEDYKYSFEKIALNFNLSLDELKSINENIEIKLRKLRENKSKYNYLRQNYINSYGTLMYDELKKYKEGIIDYSLIKEKYDNLSLDEILEIFNSSDYSLTKEEYILLSKYFDGLQDTITINKNYIEQDLYLTIFGFKKSNNHVSAKKLYPVYLAHKNEFNEDQCLILEYYFFNTIDKKTFKSNCKKRRTYNLQNVIQRLESIYYNIVGLFENNFDKEKYLVVKEKYSNKFSPLRLEMLDLFYGVIEEPLTILEISKLYKWDYVKTHDFIVNGRNLAIKLYNNLSIYKNIDFDNYIPYIKDSSFSMTKETREVMQLFMIENLSYDQISEKTGLANIRISNVITDMIRKIDNYRYCLVSTDLISLEEMSIFFENNIKFNPLEKKVIIEKKVNGLTTEEVCEKLKLDEEKVAKIIKRFKYEFYLFKIKDVTLEESEIIEELERYKIESVLDEKSKKLISLIKGYKNSWNPDGKIYKPNELSDYGMPKNVKRAYLNALDKIKARKIGLLKPIDYFILRDEMIDLLEDPHLPISDKEYNIISHLYEINGYKFYSFKDLGKLYNENELSIRRRYQRAIINILKYQNKEIEGKIDYEVDILPVLKYFSKGDSLLIEEHFKNNLTYQNISEKYNLTFDQVVAIFKKIKNKLHDYLEDSTTKKFDFEYYRKVINDDNLPFYGNLELAKQIFELFFAECNVTRNSVPKIIELLNLKIDESTIIRMINILMLSVCKLKDGIKKSEFSYDEINEFYLTHKDSMTLAHQNIYKAYFESKTRYINNYFSKVNNIITFDILKSKHNDCFNLEKMTKEEAVTILKKYRKQLKKSTCEGISILFDIKERDFMSGRELNHVYRLLNKLEKTRDKNEEYVRKRLY